MCGVFGCVAARGRALSVHAAQAIRLRDMLAHRGPDGAGLWEGQGAILAHRRLAVLDLSPAGAQPMTTADGRFTLVYNGELYNDAQVRAALERRGAAPPGGWRSACDTETVLHALAAWGFEGLARLRGMYGLALWDARQRRLLLARDPLGVKPLYFWTDGREVVFASEIPPILAHPRVSVQPSLTMVSAYLTTIRTVLGANTLFDGVLALQPGQAALCDCSGDALTIDLRDEASDDAAENAPSDGEATADALRNALAESVRLHLRSDAPMCSLLSGGIDSTAIAALALREVDALRTYAAGAVEDDREQARSMGGLESCSTSDLHFAALAAEALDTIHTSVPIARTAFHEQWPFMIERQGAPLSAPNEVAIHAIARALRADGCVVALSGEGADELLAGYEGPLDSAWRFEREFGAAMRSEEERALAAGRFQLESNAWIPSAAKPAILHSELFNAVERDEPLAALYAGEFARCMADCGHSADPVDAHLRFHQRVNLAGLLQRLDTATMLASVEGRTPFADSCIARVCAAIPMRAKYRPPVSNGGAGDSFLAARASRPRAGAAQAGRLCHQNDGRSGAGGVAVATAPRTKLALRQAFAGLIPEAILERSKASFPLPFQTWVADMGGALRASNFARQLFTAGAIETVSADPAQHWRLAWPMINIALWGDRWWG